MVLDSPTCSLQMICFFLPNQILKIAMQLRRYLKNFADYLVKRLVKKNQKISSPVMFLKIPERQYATNSKLRLLVILEDTWDSLYFTKVEIVVPSIL